MYVAATTVPCSAPILYYIACLYHIDFIVSLHKYILYYTEAFYAVIHQSVGIILIIILGGTSMGNLKFKGNYIFSIHRGSTLFVCNDKELMLYA